MSKLCKKGHSTYFYLSIRLGTLLKPKQNKGTIDLPSLAEPPSKVKSKVCETTAQAGRKFDFLCPRMKFRTRNTLRIRINTDFLPRMAVYGKGIPIRDYPSNPCIPCAHIGSSPTPAAFPLLPRRRARPAVRTPRR